MPIHDQKEFWNVVRKSSFKRKQIRNNITEDVWFQHFQALLQTGVNEVLNDDLPDIETDGDMNRPISTEEVLMALRKLRNGKAAGPDGIIGELLKNAGDQVVLFFCEIIQ
eukprot:TRINITY_DN27780_c0_g1_i1.p1 TRINITY_DN27780_c0_g1~~TRINITY_DN27780_c0_g1_i1.p1  ORF type:complete len:110 (-),score=13.44 TRINITY_DN27780_c0_g1_i1:123-452(-)